MPDSQSVVEGGTSRDLSRSIGAFYDTSSPVWEQIWGPHMHHGFYSSDGRSGAVDPRAAQRELIDRLLDWSHIQAMDLHRILDVGCGIGGTSLYLAARYRCDVVGITLSSFQAARARDRAAASGLGDHVDFQVADALEMPFENDSFELVLSLESAEHIPDKERFLRECLRVLRPGGRLVVATWCHRDTTAPEHPLRPREQRILERICRLYHLPPVVPPQVYRDLVTSVGLGDLHDADWSSAVEPFWADVVRSLFTPEALLGVMRSGWQTALGALAIPLMIESYRIGLIRYYLFTAMKGS